jgi:hypothetical protein
MTDQDDKKPKDPKGAGGYRDSPPDAPPPAPVQPTEYQQHLKTEAEVQRFQEQVRDPRRVGNKAAIAAAGGLGCMGVILWILAIVGVGIVVVIGLVIFTCSR